MPVRWLRLRVGKPLPWASPGLASLKLSIFLVALAACTVGPRYLPPETPDGTWRDPVVRSDGIVTEASNPDPLWWQEFNDPVLIRLMNLSIAVNPSLQESVLRVTEAHQNEIAAAAAGLPTLGADGSYMRQQLGLKSLLVSGGAYAPLGDLASAKSPLNQISPGLGNRVSSDLGGLLNSFTEPVNFFQYGLASSWELDLFGRVRRSVEVAKAETQAQVEATNDGLVMLESEVGQTYLELRLYQLLAMEQQQTIHTSQVSLNLTLQRDQLGLTSDLDVEQARTQLLTYQSQLPNDLKEAQQAINELNMLAGQPPGTLDVMLNMPEPFPSIPKLIGVGLPAGLARRRPDVRQAEAELHAATANIGVAVASFYPDIALTGSIGYRSIDASLLTNWASLFYSAGPTIMLPIFQGGRLTAGLRLAHAQQAQAALNYRATVLNALREVENGLVSFRSDKLMRDEIAATVLSAGHTYALAKTRYGLGLSDYLQVMDAERTLVSQQQQLLRANAALGSDVIAIFVALGGGWQLSVENIPIPKIKAPLPILPSAADSIAADAQE